MCIHHLRGELRIRQRLVHRRKGHRGCNHLCGKLYGECTCLRAGQAGQVGRALYPGPLREMCEEARSAKRCRPSRNGAGRHGSPSGLLGNCRPKGSCSRHAITDRGPLSLVAAVKPCPVGIRGRNLAGLRTWHWPSASPSGPAVPLHRPATHHGLTVDHPRGKGGQFACQPQRVHMVDGVAAAEGGEVEAAGLGDGVVRQPLRGTGIEEAVAEMPEAGSGSCGRRGTGGRGGAARHLRSRPRSSHPRARSEHAAKRSQEPTLLLATRSSHT